MASTGVVRNWPETVVAAAAAAAVVVVVVVLGQLPRYGSIYYCVAIIALDRRLRLRAHLSVG
jgi:hypothetical protein